jgi:hypothetical protein
VLFFYVSLCSEFRVTHFFSFLCCPVMYLYVLSSVLLISLVFVVLFCYVSLCFEFRVAYFFSFFRVVLLCIFMFWVPCCSFHNCFSCCPVMCLYVLSSVLPISLVFLYCPVMYLYVLSSVLLISLVFLCCSVMCFFVLRSVLLISLGFFVLFCFVSLFSEFRVAHFFSFFCVVLLCVFMFWVPSCSFL